MKKGPVLKLLVGAWHLLEQKMAFGNPTAGGFKTMYDALKAVAELNKELKAKYKIELAVSAHWWHELIVEPVDWAAISYTVGWNNPRAISLGSWTEGVRRGQLAPIGRIIPPGFGLPGSDDGAFINPCPERRELAKNMVILSLQVSELVQRENLGEGQVIYWTGPDGIRWKRLTEGRDVRLGHHLNPKLEEWRLIIAGLTSAVRAARRLGYTNTDLLIEGKPAGDPCYLDVFTDTTLEIKGIKELNRAIGAPVAQWQGEFCHSRGSGQKFAGALRQAIRAGVWGGRIHLNSGGLGQTNFTKMLSKPNGTLMSKFQQYVDNDFLPREGVKEWVEDQVKTIEIGTEWSAKTGKPFEVEFDARFCRYADIIGALKTSAEWTIEQFKIAASRRV